MNIFKRAIFLAVVTSALLFHLTTWANDRAFSGEWEYVERVSGSKTPYSTFELNLDRAGDDSVTGSYCFITQGGNRIDCDPGGAKNIRGTISKDGRHAKVQFDSFFGAKNGSAYLSTHDDVLTWTVAKNPTGDFFYGPYSVTLRRKHPGAQQGARQVVIDKAYLYPTPVINNAENYLVKGDFVYLVSVSDDLKFWKILYRKKDGERIERWISCAAISFCP